MAHSVRTRNVHLVEAGAGLTRHAIGFPRQPQDEIDGLGVQARPDISEWVSPPARDELVGSLKGKPWLRCYLCRTPSGPLPPGHPHDHPQLGRCRGSADAEAELHIVTARLHDDLGSVMREDTAHMVRSRFLAGLAWHPSGW